MDNNEKPLEIVMGGDTDFQISEVGDMTNTLKPKNHEKKENIIIPVSLTKKKEKDEDDDEEDENEKEENDETK